MFECEEGRVKRMFSRSHGMIQKNQEVAIELSSYFSILV
jgi:hypothetical protein